MFDSLLVPMDGSDYAQTALQVACKLANPEQGKIYLLAVVDPLTPMLYGGYYQVRELVWKGAIDDAEKKGRTILDHAVELMSAHQEDVQTLLRLGSPAQAIIEEASRLNVDAIVMGSRGLSDLGGLIVGSVSHKVTHVAKCTVISVHGRFPPDT